LGTTSDPVVGAPQAREIAWLIKNKGDEKAMVPKVWAGWTHGAH
jgi:hypothetical protein